VDEEYGIEPQEEEEEELRDLTDEEFGRMSIQERQAKAVKVLKIKREYFHPHLMLADSTILASELMDMNAHSQLSSNYLNRLVNKCASIPSPQ
jgi:hypothetical protein